jgi:hypothetical protein
LKHSNPFYDWQDQFDKPAISQIKPCPLEIQVKADHQVPLCHRVVEIVSDQLTTKFISISISIGRVPFVPDIVQLKDEFN